MLAAQAFLSAKVVGELKLSAVAAGPTELRLILIGLTVAMYVLGQSGPRFESLSVFDAFVGAVGTILIILFIVQTVSLARRLLKEGE